MGRAFRAVFLGGVLCASAFASGCALVDASRESPADDHGCQTAGACGDDVGDLGDSGGDDEAPTAVAGPDRHVDVGAEVLLDGGQSHPADSLTYTWTLSAPEGSSTELVRSGSVETSFRADVEGEYVATLVVSDGQSTSEPDSLTITATVPIGPAGRDQVTYTGRAVTLGTTNQPPNTSTSYQWSIVSAPPGSAAALGDPSAATPMLVPDRDGEYVVQLVIERDGVADPPDAATITSYHALTPLAYRVVDAEYSRRLDRIVIVTKEPERLYVVEPESGAGPFATLSAPPTSVSVDLAGATAAVGHDLQVTHVRLSDQTELRTRAVAVEVGDVALAGNGHVYVVGPDDLYIGHELRSLAWSTGDQVSANGPLNTSGASLKIHPSGDRIYAAASFGLGAYDIRSGAPLFLRETAYEVMYEICYDTWMSDDELHIFTRCGKILRSSTDPQIDMTYGGSLAGVDLIRHLDHSSTTDKIVAIPDVKWTVDGDDVSANKTLRFYDVVDDAFVNFDRSIELTRFIVSGSAYQAYGRFAFISADGSKVFVVVQADPAAGLANDFGITAYDLIPPP